jgi:hypothetical protein
MTSETESGQADGASPAGSTGVSTDYGGVGDPGKWLIEEYKLLSAHYFHEDNYFQQSVSVFSAINGALVAFFASNLASRATLAQLIVPLLGIVLSLVWWISLLRTRERRLYAELRIVEIEQAVARAWGDEGMIVPVLDVGSRSRWHERGRTGAWRRLRIGWVRDIPASVIALCLPLVFVIVWMILLAA